MKYKEISNEKHYSLVEYTCEECGRIDYNSDVVKDCERRHLCEADGHKMEIFELYKMFYSEEFCVSAKCLCGKIKDKENIPRHKLKNIYTYLKIRE